MLILLGHDKTHYRKKHKKHSYGDFESRGFLNFLMAFFRGPRCVPAIFLEPLHLPNTAPPHVTSPKSGGVPYYHVGIP